jgi:hypothetical protein
MEDGIVIRKGELMEKSYGVKVSNIFDERFTSYKQAKEFGKYVCIIRFTDFKLSNTERIKDVSITERDYNKVTIKGYWRMNLKTGKVRYFIEDRLK